MRRRVVAISVGGAACGAVTAGLLYFAGSDGHEEAAVRRASDTKISAESGTQAQNRASSGTAAAKRKCTLRTWRPAIAGKGANAKVVGYGSISCDKPGYTTFEVMLCKHKAAGAWSCTRTKAQSPHITRKWGTHFQLKATIPCKKAPGWETYRTEAVDHVLQSWDMHQEKSEQARLHCPG
ncbi:hypothetical protein GWI34_16810 [Actinomadura sp. DSM 109109]|nr:hypothetical protein [Actinomadura lepetitiana]